MSFSSWRLFVVLLGTVPILWVALRVSHGWQQRLVLLSVLLGLFIYSGIGSAVTGVMWDFVWFYLAFASALVAGFWVFATATRRASRRVAWAFAGWEPGVRHPITWDLLTVAYIVLVLFPLLWPDVRLGDLLRPSLPDLNRAFAIGFEGPPATGLRIATYLELSLRPFFFIAMYRHRRRLHVCALMFLLVTYVKYVESSYVGRGYVMMYLAITFLAAWVGYPLWRRRLAVTACIAAPALVIGMHVYGIVRLGGRIAEVSLPRAIEDVFVSELSFVRDVGTVIYETGSRVDKGRYARWIATLPLPKVVTGPFDVAAVNYEIAEVVLARPMAASGWYVKLSGLLSESLYIYGPWWFWLHAFMIGAAAACLVSILEGVPSFLFVLLYVAVLFAYNLNRAGIAGVLSLVTSEFMLFYLFVGINALSATRRRNPVRRSIVGGRELVGPTRP